MHRPVLLQEVLDGLAVREGGVYIDGTAGGGGHAEAILQLSGPDGRLLGMDRDAAALERVQRRLAPYASRIVLHHGNFADMISIAEQHGFSGVDGVLLDLGMSSDQVDDAARGFSFRHDGPLDMRMDRSQGATAEELVNGLGEAELADLFWRLGEERASRRIASRIVAERQVSRIHTTAHLAELVAGAKGRTGPTHPATQVFQALRMAVNRELESAEAGLEAAVRVVRPGGRVAVISFHSLEDRLVKQFFVRHEGRWESLPAGGEAWRGEEPKVKRVTRKPVSASREEMKENPRARSAKLRVAERIP
jgi:16S rRNA (cytosine1402-N4)-methyltransferase